MPLLVASTDLLGPILLSTECTLDKGRCGLLGNGFDQVEGHIDALLNKHILCLAPLTCPPLTVPTDWRSPGGPHAAPPALWMFTGPT